MVLTLGQLQRWPVRTQPSVVQTSPAAPAGARGAVVCTGGWPNVAVLTLLRQLVASDCRLRCHADFDPAGILITRHLVEHLAAEPWEMTAAYLDAAGHSRVTFDGSVADTPWDPALAEAMRAHQRVVFEEDVRRSLAAALPPGWR